MRTTVVWQKGTEITYKRLSNILSYEQADQIGKEKGYGKTVVIRQDAPFQRQLLTFVSNFVNGIHFKFPICCALAFCVDSLLGRPSAQLRWNDTTDYVPCAVHLRRYGKKLIPPDLY
jgi:hypothetical protein